MRNFLLFITCILLLSSCSSDDGVRYGDHELIITGDLETPFKNVGETRHITVSIRKQEYNYHHPQDKWMTVAPNNVKIYGHELSDQFEITSLNITADIMSFSLTAKENTIDVMAMIDLEFFWNESDGVYSLQSSAITQEPVDRMQEYRFQSDANPFVVPVEGGEFTVGFTVETRFTINGKQDEWAPTDLTWLYYSYVCNASWQHEVKLRKKEDRYGEYYFVVSAEPYFFTDESAEIEWEYKITAEGLYSSKPPLFTQVFLHSQDRELAKDPEASPLTGSVRSNGPLEI